MAMLEDVQENIIKANTQHWQRVKLGSVCDVVMGQSPSSDNYNIDGEGLPFLQGKSEFSNFHPKPTKYCTESLKIADPGTVLISVRAPVGDVNVADQLYIIGRGLASLSLKEGDNNFLFYLLTYLKPCIVVLGSGTTFQSINRSSLNSVEFSQPPLPEQRAIAHILRTVQAAIQVRRREVALERERKAALMRHLFTYGTRGESTKLTEIGEMPESWEVKPVDAIGIVAYGLTVNETRRESRKLAPYLTVANISRGVVKLDSVKQIGMLDGDFERYHLELGDVLLVEGNGNAKLLGSAAVWNSELPFALHQNHLIRIRPNQSEVLPNWLMDYINNDYGRSQLVGKDKTSNGLHSINSRVISDLLIPLPPLEEQRDISLLMGRFECTISGLENEITLLDELFRALLEELMTGRLSSLPLVEEKDA